MTRGKKGSSHCSVDGCDREGRIVRGMCGMHYARWQRHGDVGEAAPQHATSWAGVACKVDGCDSDVRSLGYCLAHYKRYCKWGDPNIRRPTTPAEERFWSKVQPNGDCWEWTGGLMGVGYGGFHPTKGKTVLAHRYAYEVMIGPIPDGLVIDHTCHNEDASCPGGGQCPHRRCVNPYHLEPVPDLENLSRGAGYGLANGRRTACVNGHERTEGNTYINPSSGKKVCRDCSRERDRNRVPRNRNDRKED